MTRERIARPVATGLPAGQLAGLAAVFALAGIGCSPAAVDKGGGSGGTAGGTGATGNPGSSGAREAQAVASICTRPPGPAAREQCEPIMANDPNCTSACRLPGGCGDGLIQPPEQCDDGALLNNGDYGGCAPSCIYAPHCGDGIKNGPEECDDGTNDGSYGGCTPQCKLGPHCGDGVTNGPEECDDGPKNGPTATCSSECKTIVYVSY